MKNNIKYFKIIALIAIVTLISCNDVDYNYKDYLKQEILYTTKPDSLDVFVGNGRIKLVPHVSNAFSVSEFVVKWNNGEESQVFQFTKSGNVVDSPELIVTGLEEKSYSFELYSRDEDGNTSVKQDFFTTSYGELYRSNLTARVIKSFVFDGVNGEINWLSSSSFERGSEVKFTDNNGDEVTVNIPVGENITTLTNVSIDSPISYRSYYVPTPYDEDKGVETSIDEFDSDWKPIVLQEELKNIVSSFISTPILGGVQMNWENVTNLSVTIVATYFIDGVEKQITLEDSQDAFGEFLIQGLADGEQDILISVLSASGNGLGSFFTVAPLPVYKFDSSNVSVVLLPTDESGIHFGGAVAELFDGLFDKTSFYHSYGTSSAKFGHHFTLDLGAPVKLGKISIFPRGPDAGSQDRNIKKYQIWGRSDLIGANTTLNSYDAGWEDEAIAKGWVLMLEEVTDSSFKGEKVNPAEAFIPSSSLNNFRYIRYRAISNHANHKRTALSEIELFYKD